MTEALAQLIAAHKPSVIGMVHFSPLDGYPDCPGKAVVLERALFDLRALQQGGVDAIMFENNFDNPKYEKLPARAAAHFEELISALAPLAKMPWGIAALWNDFELGFRLCAAHGGVLVRVPVFVDSVETVYGTFYADPARVRAARAAAGAEQVAILADVQVKHARMLEPRPLIDSVNAAADAGADGIIITGQWTGDPPAPTDCAAARAALAGRAALVTGSGMTRDNVNNFALHLDAMIVGTEFKAGIVGAAEASHVGPNIVEQEIRYDVARIAAFMESLRS